jgi:two-component system chemotaxis response regulator CheB
LSVAGHDIVLLGCSAGGLKALTSIVTALPADLPASLFVVQHLSPEYRSYLSQILADVTGMRVINPKDGEKIYNGVIYVAPPDQHMLVSRGAVRVHRGPRENGFRPSIDALFRSAAQTYGPRVVAVVLTGQLDDGTVGLQAVAKRGGVTVVQDPDGAEYPSMPFNALRHSKVDHILTLPEIAAFLSSVVQLPAVVETENEDGKKIEIESEIAEQQMDTKQFLDSVEALGSRTYFTCPACNGTLWEIAKDAPLRYRCHIGHAFTANSLLLEQTHALENALWSAIRLMEEKVSFARRLAQRQREGNMPESAESYEKYAEHLDREVGILRQLTVTGFATQKVSPIDE